MAAVLDLSRSVCLWGWGGGRFCEIISLLTSVCRLSFSDQGIKLSGALDSE